MALVNNIIIDLVAQTGTLASTQSINVVETILYSAALNQITFALRPAISLSGSDFLNLVAQINIFNSAILFNFNVNPSATLPYGSVNNTETHDSVNNLWNEVCLIGATPRVFSYSADKNTFLVNFTSRASAKTIEFPEWIDCLVCLKKYQLSVRNFFNI